MAAGNACRMNQRDGKENIMTSLVQTTVSLDYPERGTCLVCLPHAGYGSLETGKLARLRELLACLAAWRGAERLVLDLSNVQYFGAGFVGVLVDTWHLLKQSRRTLALRGLTPYCARLIRVMHLDKLFEIDPKSVLGPHYPGAWPEKPASAGSIRVRFSEVAWSPEMVRETFIGDDDVPIRSVIHPRGRIAVAR
jgi:anti-anti-sigma factor